MVTYKPVYSCNRTRDDFTCSILLLTFLSPVNCVTNSRYKKPEILYTNSLLYWSRHRVTLSQTTPTHIKSSRNCIYKISLTSRWTRTRGSRCMSIIFGIVIFPMFSNFFFYFFLNLFFIFQTTSTVFKSSILFYFIVCLIFCDNAGIDGIHIIICNSFSFC